SKWLKTEAELAKSRGLETSAQALSTAALNRYLRFFGGRLESGALRFETRESENCRVVILSQSRDLHGQVAATDNKTLRELQRNLEKDEFFLDHQAEVGIRFGEPIVLRIAGASGGRPMLIRIEYLPILPPWLLPISKGTRNQISEAYLMLIRTLRA